MHREPTNRTSELTEPVNALPPPRVARSDRRIRRAQRVELHPPRTCRDGGGGHGRVAAGTASRSESGAGEERVDEWQVDAFVVEVAGEQHVDPRSRSRRAAHLARGRLENRRARRARACRLVNASAMNSACSTLTQKPSARTRADVGDAAWRAGARPSAARGRGRYRCRQSAPRRSQCASSGPAAEIDAVGDGRSTRTAPAADRRARARGAARPRCDRRSRADDGSGRSVTSDVISCVRSPRSAPRALHRRSRSRPSPAPARMPRTRGSPRDCRSAFKFLDYLGGW